MKRDFPFRTTLAQDEVLIRNFEVNQKHHNKKIKQKLTIALVLGLSVVFIGGYLALNSISTGVYTWFGLN